MALFKYCDCVLPEKISQSTVISRGILEEILDILRRRQKFGQPSTSNLTLIRNVKKRVD